MLIFTFLWLSPKELYRLRQLSKSIDNGIHSREYIWKKLYTSQVSRDLPVNLSLPIRDMMIKTENSIKKIMSSHEAEQKAIEDVIRSEKERQHRLLQLKLVAKQQAKL